ncbi:hypothetical protein BN1708_004691 [Verticillium longisporum]|uniref:Uncharacterized protein n=1 Tax=Verticillium longisporum TaxID=100787 RepID=A0A0G4M2J3_VERLO|nr:hypothetical protein BN1708_004691 [Verticillium longisporum]
MKGSASLTRFSSPREDLVKQAGSSGAVKSDTITSHDRTSFKSSFKLHEGAPPEADAMPRLGEKQTGNIGREESRGTAGTKAGDRPTSTCDVQGAKQGTTLKVLASHLAPVLNSSESCSKRAKNRAGATLPQLSHTDDGKASLPLPRPIPPPHFRNRRYE